MNTNHGNPVPSTPQPTPEPAAHYVHVVPNSRRPYLYRGSCEYCGRVATPDHLLIASTATADGAGITPDTRWRCMPDCLCRTCRKILDDGHCINEDCPVYYADDEVHNEFVATSPTTGGLEPEVERAGPEHPDPDINLAIELATIDLEYASGLDRRVFREAIQRAIEGNTCPHAAHGDSHE